jgi:hypothetical protein
MVPCRLAKAHGGAECQGSSHLPPTVRSLSHIWRNAESTARQTETDNARRRGIEFYPEAWERFERTVQKVIKAPPVHRTGRTTGADQPKRKRRDRAVDKTSG